jgi:oligopeptide/dipeptide ABC transporter ATP-binding protein
LLQVRDVVKNYHVSRGFFGQDTRILKALDDVSLDLEAGQTLGVVGESGCGKSTLAKSIVMLEPPSQGKILFRDRDIYALSGEDLKAYRRQVQLVFQDPYSSLPARMSVGTILAEPLSIHNIGTPKERKAKAAHLLKVLGLDAKDLKRYPHMFSGGQRQRISIARALMLEPRLLIYDEPVSALDVSIQAQILRLLVDLQEQLQLTYMIISHDLRVIKYMCTQLAVMYLGRIVEMGQVESIYEQPLHPYTEALLRSIPSHQNMEKRGQQLSFLEGEVPSPINAPSGCHFHPRCPLRAQLDAEEAARCVHERPVLRVIAGKHLSACHYAEQLG